MDTHINYPGIAMLFYDEEISYITNHRLVVSTILLLLLWCCKQNKVMVHLK